MKNKETEDAYENLNKSPLFQLSLSSKELFHSNFIYWIHLAEHELFKKLVQKWVGSDIKKVTEVNREKKNFDLSIIYETDNGNLSHLIIENKVKSIPSKAQLESYTKKAGKEIAQQNTTLLLLTFSEIYELPENWQQQNYGAFIANLKFLSKELKDSYHKHLISDYCHFAGTMYDIFKDFQKDEKFFDHKIYKKAKLLRIHDLYCKCQASKVSDLITQNPIIKKQCSAKGYPKVVPGHGFTNGTGLVELFYCIDKNYSWGIQVQNKELRLAVNSPENKAEDFTKEFWGNDWWELGGEVESFQGPKRKHAGRENKIECLEYKQKGKWFLYRRRYLSEEESGSVSHIAELVVDYFCRVEKHKEEINRLKEKLSTENQSS